MSGARRTRLDGARLRLATAAAAVRPRVEAWQVRTTAWYRDRSRREQVLIAGAAILAALVLVVAVVVRPLQSARASAIRDIQTYDTLLARVRAAGPRLEAGRGELSGSPTAIATASADRFGLSIRSMEPQGAGLLVNFDAVRFDAVVQWIALVEHDSRLHVGTAKFDRMPAPGLVSAQITLVE